MVAAIAQPTLRAAEIGARRGGLAMTYVVGDPRV